MNAICNKNPHGKGHCNHTEHHAGEKGLTIWMRCCWCGEQMPDPFFRPNAHGPHEPYRDKHY